MKDRMNYDIITGEPYTEEDLLFFQYEDILGDTPEKQEILEKYNEQILKWRDEWKKMTRRMESNNAVIQFFEKMRRRMESNDANR